MRAVITFIGLLLATQAHSAEVSISYGTNPPWQGVHAKNVQLNMSHPLYGKLWNRVGYGHWFEAGDGKSGGVAAYSLGTRIEADPLFADLYWGVGYATNPDNVYLSGHLQFVNDLAVGVMRDGVGVGAGYRHVSNAGIKTPNQGRDFFLLQVRFPIGGSE